MPELKNRIARVEENLLNACERSARSRSEVTLVAVSKGVPADALREAYAAGLRVFGENRVEEALPKQAALRDLDAEWHMVGQIQTRKAREVSRAFALLHALDREKLARALERFAPPSVPPVRVLVQVDFTGAEGRGGVGEEKLLLFLESLAAFPRVAVHGLMTLPPYDPDPEKSRPWFARLRELRDRAREARFPHAAMEHLSMGMSNDFAVAVEEGATLVRVGRALFAP